MKLFTKLGLIATLATILLAIPFAAFAQPVNLRGTEIGLKIRQLDLLNQLLPVLMTKQQIKKLIPAIDRAREAERKEMAMELAEMKKMEAKVDKALKAAKEHQQVPSRELMGELIQMTKGFVGTRNIVVGIQLQAVRDELKAVLNEGQIKAAANAVDPRVFEPLADVSKMSQDKKLDYWIKYILLDWASFDLLLQMSRA